MILCAVMCTDSVYWFLVRGSWFLVLGSLFLVPGSWFLVPGSWFLVPGSWFLVPGFWLLVPGSWFLVPGSWFLVPGSWFFNGDLRHVNPGAKTRRFERKGLSGSRQVIRINSRVQNDAFLIYPNSFGVRVVCVWCVWCVR